MYQLFVGEAGSSYTFEVAQKNGIPYGLINRAKKKIAGGKVRFDKTIANLQKERSGLRNLSKTLKEQEQTAKVQAEELAQTQQKVQEKLERYQEVFDANQRLLILGRKVDQLAVRYFNKWTKKGLLDALFKLVMQENSKRTPKTKLKPVGDDLKNGALKKTSAANAKGTENREKYQSKPNETNNKQAFDQELKQEVAQLRASKKAKKQKEAQQKPEKEVVFNLGDRVRMIDGVAVGTIDKIEKNKVIINYGTFTTTVKKDYIEKL
jgi:DNA mismatch repair protein MutS2